MKLSYCVDDWPIVAGDGYFSGCMRRMYLDENLNNDRFIKQAEPGDFIIISVTLVGSTSISSELAACFRPSNEMDSMNLPNLERTLVGRIDAIWRSSTLQNVLDVDVPRNVFHDD